MKAAWQISSKAIVLVLVAGGIAYASRNAWWPKPTSPKLEFVLNAKAQRSFDEFMQMHIPLLEGELARIGYKLQPSEESAPNAGPIGSWVAQDTDLPPFLKTSG